MHYVSESFERPGYETQPDPEFPNAPSDWTREIALHMALKEGLALAEVHWKVVRALQEFYAGHAGGIVNVRELHDALDEHFHTKGGIKYLYQQFPKGPVAQGCLLAGLQAPAGAQDKGIGSAL